MDLADPGVLIEAKAVQQNGSDFLGGGRVVAYRQAHAVGGHDGAVDAAQPGTVKSVHTSAA
jgi:hypothetical protein